MSNKAGAKKAKGAETVGLVPRLRFPEFRGAGEWLHKNLEDIARFFKGRGISKSDIDAHGEIPCIRYGELYTTYGEVIKAVVSKTRLPLPSLFLSQKYDVLIPSSGETRIDIARAACVLINGVALGGDLNVLRSQENGVFLSYLLNGVCKKTMAKRAQGDTVVHLYPRHIELLPILIPDRQEQQKIADCLSSLDEVITLESQKLEALKVHKKGLMQQLFPAEGETVPRLRFPEFRGAGDWGIEKLKRLATRVVARNVQEAVSRVLTNSAEYGVIDQRDYFDKDIANKSNLGGYYIVEEGDYVYNPRISEMAPVGPTSKNNIGTGVMSPLYTVFRFHNRDNGFYAHYFASSHWHRYLREVSNSGARHDRMAVSSGEFFDMPVPAPQEKEQQKIADCLSFLDEVITLESKKLEALKVHKKGLMQQLFPSADV